MLLSRPYNAGSSGLQPICRVCRRSTLAATLTMIAMAIHTNQLDNGPDPKGNVSVHPRFAARLQEAKAYPENTAGPMSAATNAPNSWAVSVAHAPVRVSRFPEVCNNPLAREVSVVIAIAVVCDSGIFSACTDFDARKRPKVPGLQKAAFYLDLLFRSR